MGYSSARPPTLRLVARPRDTCAHDRLAGATLVALRPLHASWAQYLTPWTTVGTGYEHRSRLSDCSFLAEQKRALRPSAARSRSGAETRFQVPARASRPRSPCTWFARREGPVGGAMSPGGAGRRSAPSPRKVGKSSIAGRCPTRREAGPGDGRPGRSCRRTGPVIGAVLARGRSVSDDGWDGVRGRPRRAARRVGGHRQLSGTATPLSICWRRWGITSAARLARGRRKRCDHR